MAHRAPGKWRQKAGSLSTWVRTNGSGSRDEIDKTEAGLYEAYANDVFVGAHGSVIEAGVAVEKFYRDHGR